MSNTPEHPSSADARRPASAAAVATGLSVVVVPMLVLYAVARVLANAAAAKRAPLWQLQLLGLVFAAALAWVRRRVGPRTPPVRNGRRLSPPLPVTVGGLALMALVVLFTDGRFRWWYAMLALYLLANDVARTLAAARAARRSR